MRASRTRKPRLGQPPKMAGGRRVNVYLGTEALEQARKIGQGNVSEGLRKALDASGSPPIKRISLPRPK